MRDKRQVIAAAFLFIFFLVGCGAENTAQEDIAQNREGQVVLQILDGQSTSDAGIEDMIDEALADKMPDVVLEWECVDWGESFDSQLQGRIVSGDVPDIIIGKAQDVKPYAEKGILAEVAIDEMDAINDEVLQTTTLDGKVYGLPYNAWYQGVIYNKNIFRQLGLDVPTTKAELNHVVAVCKENGITPFAAHFQESWKVANMTMQFMIENLFIEDPSFGTRFWRGEESFGQNANVQSCIEENRFIYENTWDDAANINQYESDKRFAQEEAAMYLTGTWSLQSVDQYAKEGTEYGIFPYPLGKSPKLIKETNMTFMMSSTSENQEEILQVFEELFSNQELMQEILGFTQTYSVVDGIASGYQSSVQPDIDQYEAVNRIIGAEIGNNQLVWSFQNDFATQTQSWLKQEITMKELLDYADEQKKIME